jgi:hypothetical protein
MIDMVGDGLLISPEKQSREGWAEEIERTM